MEEFRLERLAYTEAEAYARQGAIVLVPISPLEAHGPHLPLGVDFFGARTLAEMCAERLIEMGVATVVAPVLPYGLADVAMPFAGTVSLKKDTIKALIKDLAQSFVSHGFKGMVVVCQHMERANLAVLQTTSEELTRKGTPVITLNPFFASAHEMHAMMKGEFPELDFHAGEWETAFCLWMCPDLVKKELIDTLPPNWVDLREKLDRQGCKDFVEAGGPQCYFGDPSPATADQGKKIYEAVAKTLTDEVIGWIDSNSRLRET